MAALAELCGAALMEMNRREKKGTIVSFPDSGGLTDLVFTAGIGEHSGRVRAMVCRKRSAIGGKPEEEANRVCAPGIPTDEELGIARSACELI